MAGAGSEDRIAELNAKLDFIVEELAALKRARLNVEDLMADLTIVGKDAMGDAVEALGSTALRPEEVIHLAKTALLNATLLEKALEHLGSAADFVADAQPIVRDLFHRAMDASQKLERKGYLRAGQAGMRIGDSLIQSHSAEDLKQVERSVPQLIGFLRELTKPQVLEALEAIIHGFGEVQATMNVNKSLVGLVRDFNSPDARRGMALLAEFLKVVGARAAAFTAQDSSKQKM